MEELNCVPMKLTANLGIRANQLKLLLLRDSWDELSDDAKFLLIDLMVDFENDPEEDMLVTSEQIRMEKEFDLAKKKAHNKVRMLWLIRKKYGWSIHHTQWVIKEITGFLSNFKPIQKIF